MASPGRFPSADRPPASRLSAGRSPARRSAAVVSHRRGGARRRFRGALWIALGSIILLAGTGTAIGLSRKDRGPVCTGLIEVTIMATPRIEPILKQLGADWTASKPSVNGMCGSVTVLAAESPDVATALAGDWDETTQGPAPDVWVPDSTAWARKASADADAERIMPDLYPSLARTPTVIAMPKPLAEAARMGTEALGWREIVERLNQPDGWGAYGHPEWGPFRLGLSDPQTSTAGLLALMALSDADDDGEVSDAERAALLGLRHVITITSASTDDIIAGMTGAGAASLTYVSAFPALEQDVLRYNLDAPAVPLVAVYPSDGMAEADFPYLILDADWNAGEPIRRDAAAQFLAYARGDQGRTAFLAAGLRDPNRAPGPDLSETNGLISRLTALPRAVLVPESVQLAAASWTAVTRPTNVLLVFDTSGSMWETVRGTGKNRLDLTKAAAQSSLELLDDTARVGVWEFSSGHSRGQDYRVVVDIAPLGEENRYGQTHRELIDTQIKALQPGGNTGLYNATWAACQHVRDEAYVEGAANLILVLTDGADDNNVGNITIEQLESDLKSTCGSAERPVKVITIGLGVDSDSEVLRRISAATNATSFSSPDSYDISQVVLTALYS